MTPERETAINFLSAQVQRYREELRIWLRAPQGIRSAAQARLVAPLQDLVEDASRLLARLRGRPAVPANDSEPAGQVAEAPARKQER
jgi:hypothetical protein